MFKNEVGKTIRLKGAFIVTCDNAVKDADGKILKFIARTMQTAKADKIIPV